MRLIDADALLSECKLAQEQISYDRQYANAFYSAGGCVSTEWWCIEDMIEDAPTIEPERKKGQWNRDGDIPNTCSICGEDWDKYVEGQEIWYTGEIPNFCPNCGSYNGGGEEE